MKGINIAEQCHVVNGLGPVDIGGVAKTSDYVDTSLYSHINIIVTTGVVTNTATFTLYESDDSAGTTKTAIDFDYYAETTAAGDTPAARTATASAAGFATGTANTTLFIIDLDASALTDGYPYLAVVTDTAAAALVAVTFVLSGTRYGQELTPTAIT